MDTEILEYLKKKFGENPYRIAVGKSPLKRGILIDQDRPVAYYNEDGNHLWFLFDSEKQQNSVIHTPTDGFWETILITEHQSSRMAEYITHSEAYGLKDNLPDLDEWRTLYNHEIPKCEANLCHSLSRLLLGQRMKTKTVYSDHPDLRKLVRRAYIELDIPDIPEYLYVDDISWEKFNE